jgi:hypothetical protein
MPSTPSASFSAMQRHLERRARPLRLGQLPLSGAQSAQRYVALHLQPPMCGAQVGLAPLSSQARLQAQATPIHRICLSGQRACHSAFEQHARLLFLRPIISARSSAPLAGLPQALQPAIPCVPLFHATLFGCFECRFIERASFRTPNLNAPWYSPRIGADQSEVRRGRCGAPTYVVTLLRTEHWVS